MKNIEKQVIAKLTNIEIHTHSTEDLRTILKDHQVPEIYPYLMKNQLQRRLIALRDKYQMELMDDLVELADINAGDVVSTYHLLNLIAQGVVGNNHITDVNHELDNPIPVETIQQRSVADNLLLLLPHVADESDMLAAFSESLIN